VGENPARRNPGGDENKLAMFAAGTHNDTRFPMPTYDYACPKCGHAFEFFQSMRDEPLTTCPKCKKKGVKRLIGGGAGLIFKGSGFYITDYKNKPAPAQSGGAENPAPTAAPAATPAKPASTVS
jgi:putative FmdB family regulatory protein